MGFIDFIKSFFVKKESSGSISDAMRQVRAAAQASNYNQASIQAFYALEVIADVNAQTKREQYTTPREFSQELINMGGITEDDLEPIIQNFERAKYSPFEVSFEEYRTVEDALEMIIGKYRSGAHLGVKTERKAKPKKKMTKRSTGRGTGAPREKAAPRKSKEKKPPKGKERKPRQLKKRPPK